MTRVDRQVVERKLARITDNLELLGPIAELSRDAYLEQPYTRKATERLLQEIVEAAVDVNAHVAVRSGRGAPETLHASFDAVADAGAIPLELAAALAPSAGLRNRLVHEYDRLDDAIIHGAVAFALAQYGAYVAAILAFVDRQAS